MKSNLDVLRDLDKVVQELKDNPTPNSYWEKEAEMLEALHKKQQKEADAIRMTYDKFIKPFDL